MSLISEVGRRSWKSRSLMAAIYLCLSLLGATMVIPFMITITGSMSNVFDYDRFSPIPRYLWSQEDRYVKVLVQYFNSTRGWTSQMGAYASQKPDHWRSWSTIGRDIENVDKFGTYYLRHPNPAAALDYSEFMDTYPLTDCFVTAPQIQAINFLMEKYTREYLKKHPGEEISGKALRLKGLEQLSEDWNLPMENFYSIDFNSEMQGALDFQRWFPPANPKYLAYNDYKLYASAHYFTPGVKKKWFAYLKEHGIENEELFPVFRSSADPKIYQMWSDFKRKYAPASPCIPFALRTAWYAYLGSEDVTAMNGGRKINVSEYNRLAKTNFTSLQETPFPIPSSFGQDIQKIWYRYLQERFPLRLISIEITPETKAMFHQFNKENLRYLNKVNELLGTQYKSWEELPLDSCAPNGHTPSEINRRALWISFVRNLPNKYKKYSSSEIEFQKFAMKKYKDLATFNKVYGTKYKYVEEIFPPFMAAYTQTFLSNETAMTYSPVLDNYKIILDYLVFNGNAILVTLLLITLSIAFTLTINPLAAYALSRFNLPGHNQILIFMLATMAFPAMVSAIPAYLLMRDLGLLNTFWALVLPGAANGMAIFILKGFFDSLPMELFEAATIDGASEMQIFWVIAMPMVKPILAINCLNAFIAAYNGWEWALIICQDKAMWTIAVWMYQASDWWGGMPYTVCAGFVLVSIPTMIVFISCQKIILRGIIIPTMK